MEVIVPVSVLLRYPLGDCDDEACACPSRVSSSKTGHLCIFLLKDRGYDLTIVSTIYCLLIVSSPAVPATVAPFKSRLLISHASSHPNILHLIDRAITSSQATAKLPDLRSGTRTSSSLYPSKITSSLTSYSCEADFVRLSGCSPGSAQKASRSRTRSYCSRIHRTTASVHHSARMFPLDVSFTSDRGTDSLLLSHSYPILEFVHFSSLRTFLLRYFQPSLPLSRVPDGSPAPALGFLFERRVPDHAILHALAAKLLSRPGPKPQAYSTSNTLHQCHPLLPDGAIFCQRYILSKKQE
jgi:hypothetical protein